MGLFDDTERLNNRTFGWGLAPYTERSEGWEDAESPPEDSSALSVYIDEEGSVNINGPIQLYDEKDPIDGPVEHTYSKENNFIGGLRKAIGPFPTYGVLVYPTVLPGSREVISEGGGLIGPVIGPGTRARFPRDTPEGFVPCAGQILKYPRSSGIGDVVVPNMASASITSGAGDGATTSTVYYAPPGGAWMMKVPDGYTEMVPDLRGRELADFGTPVPVGLPV